MSCRRFIFPCSKSLSSFAMTLSIACSPVRKSAPGLDHASQLGRHYTICEGSVETFLALWRLSAHRRHSLPAANLELRTQGRSQCVLFRNPAWRPSEWVVKLLRHIDCPRFRRRLAPATGVRSADRSPERAG